MGRSFLSFLLIVTYCWIKTSCQSVGSTAVDFSVSTEKEDLVEDVPAPTSQSIIYFATAPKNLYPYRNFPISVTIKNATLPVNVAVAISSMAGFQMRGSGMPIATSNALIAPGQTNKFLLPINQLDSEAFMYQLNITGRDASGNNFSDTTSLYARPAGNTNSVVFIQTDKPLYKVGDTVRFRIVTLDTDLRPIYLPIDVKIYDPQRNLIKQYLSAANATVKGLISGEIEIASQALQGSWSIEADSGTLPLQRKIFSVQEYVLPRFDVQVKTPATLAFFQKSFDVSISANYTFGEAVKGTATVSIQGPANWVQVPASASPPMSFSTPGTGLGVYPSSPFIYNTPYAYTYQNIAPWKNFTFENFDGSATVNVKVADVVDLGNTQDWQSLTVVGSVTEGTTNIRKNTTAKQITLMKQSYRLKISESSSTFIPGVPFTVYVKAEQNDGRPIPPTMKKMKVQIQSTGSSFGNGETFGDNEQKEFSVPASGIVAVDVAPTMLTRTIYLTAQLGRISTSESIRGFVSPSSSYLQINPLSKVFKVGDVASFSIQLMGQTPLLSIVNYTVLAKGRIILESSLPASGSQTVLRFQVPPVAAPRARLFVYYIRPDNEIVANVIDFAVEGLMRNNVNLTVTPENRSDYTQPSETAIVRIQTSPNSIVGLLGMDQSLLLLATGNDITQSAVDDAVEGLGDNSNYNFANAIGNSTNVWTSTGGSVWSFFQNAGLVVLSNAVIPGSPQSGMDMAMGFGGGMAPMGMASMAGAVESSFGGSALMASPPSGGQNEAVGFAGPVPAAQSISAPTTEPPKLRKEFPETFLYETLSSGSSGDVEIRRKVPDTITSWVCTAFSLNEELGLGVTKEASTLKVFQPFFVVLNLPYSVVRGETLNLEILVFNYLNQDQNVQVLLEASGEDWRGAQYAPGPQRSTGMVGSNNSTRFVFPVTPTIVGDINIKVTAQSNMAGDAMQKKLLVKAEGVTQRFSAPIFLDLRSKNNMVVQVPLTIPSSGFVPGSERVTVYAIGDLLGPTINGIENLIRLPTGCGEQNMVNLAPNVFVAQYLQRSNRLDESTRNRLLRNINSGYQRQLTYGHFDGSFSAFGNHDKSGSTFLTAFVLKTLFQARNYIVFDKAILEKAANWLLKKQSPRGSFVEVGKVFDTELQGGVKGPVALTAYVVIALLESQPALQQEMQNNISRAVAFLESELRTKNLDAYQLSIVINALSLVGSNAAQPAISQFESLAINANGTKHWSQERETVTTYSGKYQWEYQLPAKDIEMTAYGLLRYSRASDVQGGFPVLAWLLSKRNEQGGFQSSQDTVVALQALAEFAALAQDSSKAITVDVSGMIFSRQFSINGANALVLQSFEPSSFDDVVKVQASGRGTALVQLAWSYNVKNVPEKAMFDVQVKANSGQQGLKLDVCIRYLGTGNSNMVVAEVNVPSGYQMEEDALKDLTNDVASGISRVDVVNDGNKAEIYFDEVSQTQCFAATAFRIHQVQNTADASIVVYDYYNPMNRKTVAYKV